jgi:hypothetical protein
VVCAFVGSGRAQPVSLFFRLSTNPPGAATLRSLKEPFGTYFVVPPGKQANNILVLKAILLKTIVFNIFYYFIFYFS